MAQSVAFGAVERQRNGRPHPLAVDDVRERIAAEVQFPAGYFIRFGGQFENLARAQERLAIVVPLALVLIFGLLYVTYRRVLDALRIFMENFWDVQRRSLRVLRPIVNRVLPGKLVPREAFFDAFERLYREVEDVRQILLDGDRTSARLVVNPARVVVEETRRSGAKIDLEMQVDDVAAAPGALGRDAYRIVQEALTNVRKHARGTRAAVRVAGAPNCGLHVSVRNPPAVGAHDRLVPPGAGAGLLGLQERVALANGVLVHGPDETGGFVVEADLPW